MAVSSSLGVHQPLTCLWPSTAASVGAVCTLQELEALHAERKAVYDAAMGGLEGTVSKLQSSVADLQKEVGIACLFLSCNTV